MERRPPPYTWGGRCLAADRFPCRRGGRRAPAGGGRGRAGPGGPAVVVYADLLALANFAIDAALLWATARVAGAEAAPGRVALAAALGAAYATAAYAGALPAPLSGRWAVLLAPVAMVAIGLRPRSLREAGRATAWFYLLAAAVYGAASLVSLAPGPGLVLAVAMAAAAGGAALWRGLLRARAAAGQVVRLVLRVGQRRLEVAALVDSGHLLRDPLGGEWVVVAEADVVAQLAAASDPGRPRWRLIPYASVDREGALMVGIRCDEVCVEWSGGRGCLPGVVVARVPGGGIRLDPQRRYRALVPLGLLAEIEVAGQETGRACGG